MYSIHLLQLSGIYYNKFSLDILCILQILKQLKERPLCILKQMNGIKRNKDVHLISALKLLLEYYCYEWGKPKRQFNHNIDVHNRVHEVNHWHLLVVFSNSFADATWIYVYFIYILIRYGKTLIIIIVICMINYCLNRNKHSCLSCKYLSNDEFQRRLRIENICSNYFVVSMF